MPCEAGGVPLTAWQGLATHPEGRAQRRGSQGPEPRTGSGAPGGTQPSAVLPSPALEAAQSASWPDASSRPCPVCSSVKRGEPPRLRGRGESDREKPVAAARLSWSVAGPRRLRTSAEARAPGRHASLGPGRMPVPLRALLPSAHRPHASPRPGRPEPTSGPCLLCVPRTRHTAGTRAPGESRRSVWHPDLHPPTQRRASPGWRQIAIVASSPAVRRGARRFWGAPAPNTRP